MLTGDQLAFYRDYGYLLVKGLLPRDEAAGLRRECHDLIERLARDHDTDATWAGARAMMAAATAVAPASPPVIADNRRDGGATEVAGASPPAVAGAARPYSGTPGAGADVAGAARPYSGTPGEGAAVAGAARPYSGTPGEGAAVAGAARPYSGATVIHHCHNVQFYSAALSKLLTDERFTEAAAQVIDRENVQLHHNKLFIKPPEKGSPFPMHQDYPYFPHARNTMTAAIFHFDDAPIEKGCLRVIPGSHRRGPLAHEGNFYLPLDQYPLEAATICEAEAGDVLFFNYLTIHGSGVNESHEARTTLLVQFRDPEDRPLDDQHKSRGQGMMLRGIDPDPEPQFGE